MNMNPIETRITEEARKRANVRLADFSIIPLLEKFKLDQNEKISIVGPQRNSHFPNRVEVTIEELNEALRESLLA